MQAKSCAVPDTFTSLDVYVRGRASQQEPLATSNLSDDLMPTEIVLTPIADVFREVRRFRAALADSLEAVRADLLTDLAADVLARELRLAPADIARIVESVLERANIDDVVRILVHPDDVAALEGASISVQSDTRLRRGDASIVLRYGTIDASLGVRLADVLNRW